MAGPVQTPPGFVVFERGTVDSTQDEVRALAKEGAEDGTVVWAERQSQGRGRQARHWDSPAGNLYFSLLLRPRVGLAKATQLSLVAALAVWDSVQPHLEGRGRLTLKWPNDVLLDGAKLSGILLETQPGPDGGPSAVVIGVGVNLASHPAKTPYPATDLTGAGIRHLTPGRLLGDYLAAFDEWRTRWRSRGFAPVRAAWLEHAHGLGGPVTARLPDKILEGRFVTLDENGALVLETGTGARHVVTAGDVSVG